MVQNLQVTPLNEMMSIPVPVTWLMISLVHKLKKKNIRDSLPQLSSDFFSQVILDMLRYAVPSASGFFLAQDIKLYSSTSIHFI